MEYSTIVSVVAVLAAQRVTIRNDIKVTYVSLEVAGEFEAYYQVQNGAETKIGDTIVLNGDEEGSLDAPYAEDLEEDLDLTLTRDNRYVTFTFKFKNTGTTSYTAALSRPTHENLKMTYSVPNAGGATKIDDVSFTLAGGTTEFVVYTITYTVDDLKAGASFDDAFVWTLTNDQAGA